jgi:hypothetical protein
VKDLSRLALGQLYRWKPASARFPVALRERAPMSLERAAAELELTPEQLWRWIANNVPLLHAAAVSDRKAALGTQQRRRLPGEAQQSGSLGARSR